MDKLKEEFIINLATNNDFDNDDFIFGVTQLHNYRDICDEIFQTKNMEYIVCIMQTMKNWTENVVDIGDRLIGFAIETDSQKFQEVFLHNLHLMYPHAKEGIHYIFNHLLTMEQFLPYLYDTFLAIDIVEKRIFKEIYQEIILNMEAEGLIPKIDEALKSIA